MLLVSQEPGALSSETFPWACVPYPPGGHYFGCRHCYDLTYRSCQDSHKLDRLYEEMARILSENAPEGFPIIITPKLIRESLREDFDE